MARVRAMEERLAIEVCAHVTGTVWKVDVTPGAEVNEGDVLFVLESMKMEIPVEAPAGGRVLDVHVVEGAAITEGMVLARIG